LLPKHYARFLLLTIIAAQLFLTDFLSGIVTPVRYFRADNKAEKGWRDRNTGSQE
jgi:hypothetical protein